MRPPVPENAELSLLRRRCSKKWSRYPADVLPVWLAEMDFPLAEPIARRLVERIELADLGYPALAADHPLPSVFAEWAGREWNWPVDPADVAIIPDVMRGVEMCLKAFSAPGDGVIVFPPIYPPFLESIADYDRVPVHCPVTPDGEGWALDLDAVRSGLAAGARLILLCSPHNPTGHVPPAAELRALAGLADRYDAVIVSDEVHAPLVYDGFTHTPIATLGDEVAARTVTLFSASKAWNLPGLRCALAVAGPRLRAVLNRLPRRFANGTGILGMEAAVAAFQEGSPWLTRIRARLDANRGAVARLLAEQVPQIRYRVPDAGYLAWLDCTELGWTNPAERFLAEGRVALNSGLDFGPGGEGHARLNFATPEPILREAVRRIAAAVADPEGVN